MNSKKPGSSHTRVLLDSGDEEEGTEEGTEKVGWSINKDYAKKYDDWRAKEEMQKLKDRYGDNPEEESSSSSESEDEDAEALTPQIERDFFTTLSILKSDDPRIYDKSQKYFQDELPSTSRDDDPATSRGDRAAKKPMYLRDYERKVLLEQDGVIDEGKSQPGQRFQSTYDQEQVELKRGLAALVHGDSDDESDGLLVERKKSQAQLEKDEDDYSVWLRSQPRADHGEVSEKKNAALKPLKQFWSDPTLDDGEKFLRDYLLDRKFVEKDKDRLPSYGEIVDDEQFSEEEEELEKAEEFEQKYNFRFEEPDPDFIKRFPRTMADSLRRKDDKRKTKRDEIKERKDSEKERVREDIKQLKSLKRREILQKIDKLKSVSGNEDLNFGEDDLEGDFDPSRHDALMKKVFSDSYYGGEELEKPDISDESDLDENFAEDRECEDAAEAGLEQSADETAEDRTPSTSTVKEGKRKRRTKVSEAVQQSKPAFDPHKKKLEEYLDEYYKLDFEDIVAGMPCRFKYRSVIPNDFGLTADEILTAPDRELNAWCSLKKTVQHRSEEEEMYDIRAFKQKASLGDIKRKIIPSLADAEAAAVSNVEKDDEPKKKKRNRKKNKDRARTATETAGDESRDHGRETSTLTQVEETVTLPESAEVIPSQPAVSDPPGNGALKLKKRRKRNKKPTKAPTTLPDVGEGEPVDMKTAAGASGAEVPAGGDSNGKKNRSRKKRRTSAAPGDSEDQPLVKKQKTSYDHEKFVKALPSTRITDERLKAYGLNPKKHRAKEKYVLMAKAKSADG